MHSRRGTIKWLENIATSYRNFQLNQNKRGENTDVKICSTRKEGVSNKNTQMANRSKIPTKKNDQNNFEIGSGYEEEVKDTKIIEDRNII